MTKSNTNLAPILWRHDVSNTMMESFANNRYYLFVGDHTTHANLDLQSLQDTVSTTLQSAYRNMIEGKLIGAEDVAMLIRNIPYESNKVFDMYDDLLDLFDLDYYAIVNASSFYHVYKVLDNNQGSNSIVQPNFADISGANTNFYQTSDGYVWKYMYSIDNNSVVKFGTSNNFPVVANTSVKSGAVAGAIDVILIETAGVKYNNYVLGTFSGADIQVNGDALVFQIANNNTVAVNGFYQSCLLYISAGTGVGQYKTVTDYFSNTDGNFIRVDSAFAIAPQNGSQYQIYPQVQIVGSGSETINAVARALINATSSNSVYKIEMLLRGADYQLATAEVLANNVVGVTQNAALRVIYGPYGGHGYHQAPELSCGKVAISVQLSNSESNTILTTNKYQQFGIIQNPRFANVEITIANNVGIFLGQEPVWKISPLKITSIATINSLSSSISANDGTFTSLLKVGDFVYLTIANNNSNQLATVNSIINSTMFTIASNGFFDSIAGIVNILVGQSISANVLSVVSAQTLRITHVNGAIVANDFIIGQRSGAIATVNTVSRNGVLKNYETFVQLYKYNGVTTFGTFAQNEFVYQGNLAQSNALLHSSINDGSNTLLYTSNQDGLFANGLLIVGNTSGAILSVANTYSPELVYGSGKVVYLENIDPVTRLSDQTEKFKVIFIF
jgi:hypothetical protein